MAKFYWQTDPGVVLLEAEQGEELSIEMVKAAAASDLAWATRQIAEALGEIQDQLERIAGKMPSEWS